MMPNNARIQKDAWWIKFQESTFISTRYLDLTPSFGIILQEFNTYKKTIIIIKSTLNTRSYRRRTLWIPDISHFCIELFDCIILARPSIESGWHNLLSSPIGSYLQDFALKTRAVRVVRATKTDRRTCFRWDFRCRQSSLLSRLFARPSNIYSSWVCARACVCVWYWECMCMYTRCIRFRCILLLWYVRKTSIIMTLS